MAPKIKSLEQYRQIISAELMAALEGSAKVKGISIDLEIALRLVTALTVPELNQDRGLYQHIMQRSFSYGEARAECQRKRNSALYLYEVEKLRLFLQFEQSLPKGIKEQFQLIDVKEVSKTLRAELAAEAAKE